MAAKLPDNAKTPMVVCVIGAVFFFIESIIDIIIRDIYSSPEFSEVGISAEVMMVMAIIGIFMSLIIMGILFYMYKVKVNKTHFVAILVISLLAFFGSSSVFSVIILIVGSIIGIVKVNNKK